MGYSFLALILLGVGHVICATVGIYDLFLVSKKGKEIGVVFISCVDSFRQPVRLLSNKAKRTWQARVSNED